MYAENAAMARKHLGQELWAKGFFHDKQAQQANH